MTYAYLMQQLFELGHKMRVAQREYFKTKSQQSLADSKKYEKQFDNLLFNIKSLKDAGTITN